jgi:predicted permease
MGTLLRDLKYGLRMLARSPGFAAVVVLSLALGIGANTAIFTLIDAVMLKNLPVEKPDQLVVFDDNPDEGMITGGPPSGRWSYFSYPVFEYLRDHDQVLQGLAAFQRIRDRLIIRAQGAGAGETAQRAMGRLVSGSYFSVLGVNAVLGRTLTPDDDQPGAHPAAVISYGYWKRRFSRDPSTVGKVVDLNGTPFIIVGVTPPEFFGETVQEPPDFWLPLSLQPQVTQRGSFLKDTGTYWLNLLGRLKPGVTKERAQATVTAQLRQYLMAQWGSQIPSGNLQEIQGDHIALAPGGRGISRLRVYYSEPLHILMAVVALVLLIACANVANLLLARAAARQKEISMRLALGASRRRLVRQLLTESVLLAGLGGVLGTLFATWGVKLLVALVASNDPLNLNPDARVVGFTFAVSLLTGILFGLAPALRATKIELAPALKANASGPAGAQRGRFGPAKALVVFQVALSLPLVLAASLLLRSLEKLEGQNLGIDQEHILLVQIDPRLAGYKPNQLGSLYQRLLDRVNVLPGVRSASLAFYSPLSGSSQSGNISIQGYTPRPGQNMDSWYLQVGPKYFETEGIPLLLGRAIGPQDTQASPPAAVVNDSFARYFFPNQNPIGKRFSPGEPFKSPGIEIVGVVADVKYESLREKVPRMLFLPVFQMEGDSVYVDDLEVRTVGDPTSVATEVERAIPEIDKNLPVLKVTTLSEQVHGSVDQERTISELSSFFGLLALTLACVGLYGLMAYTVARRTNEIGIRMALGAERADILRMVMRETLLLVVAGVAIGIPVALAAARLISSRLFGLTPTDQLMVLLATLLMTAVAAFAGYLPARRASRVNPMVALRYE